MMETNFLRRMLSLVLTAAILLGFAVPVQAEGSHVPFEPIDNSAVTMELRQEVQQPDEQAYADSELVRVSIVLKQPSVLGAGYPMQNVAKNASVQAYRENLKAQQDETAAAIARAIAHPLDVVWNLTLAGNIISANVEYGKLDQIRKVSGVEKVLVENAYVPAVLDGEEPVDPNMSTSSAQIGSGLAWASGYTGAGSRVAVIDTGIDVNHQSFSNEGFQYSLAYQAGLRNCPLEQYIRQLDLMEAEDVALVRDQLNVDVDPETAYISSKIPYAYNYIDKNYQVTHVKDSQGEHGSHVSGIIGANAFLPNGDGSFSTALESVKVQGVAPDAQILTMKVFGQGSPYESDYLAAIEDAVVLGCDSVNLSMGTNSAGTSISTTEEYQDIMEDLTNSGIVVCVSAGNNGSWVDHSLNPVELLYAEDVNMHTGGAPGSYTNSLCVASVDNAGATGLFFRVGDVLAIYNERLYQNLPFATLAGDRDYVLIDGLGTDADWEAVGEALTGKIALCSRGDLSFFDKAINAVNHGAIATVIYNNQPGIINMDLSPYTKTEPCVAVTQDVAEGIRKASEAVTDENGNVLYYTGTMYVSEGVDSGFLPSKGNRVSSFSSWGVPGSLELKPEIAAPGGGIYSVNGEHMDKGALTGGTDQYENMSGTSMAAPQVSGMAAVFAQYVRESGLDRKTGMTPRQLAHSLLMSTAIPVVDESTGVYFPVLQQGAGLGNVGAAIAADSYLTMAEDATRSYADGKVKAELGDDPQRNGVYDFHFTIHNLENSDKAFALSADFFTQAFREDRIHADSEEMAVYMEKETQSLATVVEWEADGEALVPTDVLRDLDFDGSGSVNAADGQLLLESVVDPSVVLQHADRADLDGNGTVNSHDAYLFFQALGTGTVLVPANGSMEIHVTVTLTDAWREQLAYAPNGLYVEGYVFAESLASAEGVEGTCHSIPVLGFFGNWSDPSMFEVGNYAQVLNGQEKRQCYMGYDTVNRFLLSHAHNSNRTYPMGGNPLTPDAVYRPERNAINTENGDFVNQVQFGAIRQGAASRFSVKNCTTGEYLREVYMGSFGAAYYMPVGGRWMDGGYLMHTNFHPDGIAEGDQLEMAMTLAPEYYVDENGRVDWEALGHGASMTMPLVADNTAPELLDVSLSLTGNTLTVTARDNQYVAGVALFNRTGDRLEVVSGSKADIEPGETAEYTLDISKVNGQKFALRVMDYAMNTATFALDMTLGTPEPLPELIAYTMDAGFWFALERDFEYDLLQGLPPYGNTENVFTAATIMEHTVIAANDRGELFAMPEDDLGAEKIIGYTHMLFTDMAYNAADGKVYAVCDGILYTVDPFTAETVEIGEIGVDTNTLACNAEGTFYCNELDSSNIYRFTLDTLEDPEWFTDAGDDITAKYMQSMEVNPNDGRICWASYYTWYMFGYEIANAFYIEFDPVTGEDTLYTDLWDEITALIIPKREEGESGGEEPEAKVRNVMLSETEITVLTDAEKKLEAAVQPWTVSDGSVIWTSENESIAAVSEKGVVTGIQDGTTRIIATSKLDPSVSAACTVHVETLNLDLHGTVRDEAGDYRFFTWNVGQEETWTPGNLLDTSVVSAAYDSRRDCYYIQEDGNSSAVMRMHRVSPQGESLEITAGNKARTPLWDMSYSEYSSTEEAPRINSVFAFYFMPPKDPMNMDLKAFNFIGQLDYLAAVASVGYEQKQDEETGETLDTEHVILLDNGGVLHHLWMYPGEEEMEALFSEYPSDLILPLEGFNMEQKLGCSMELGEDGALYVSCFNGDSTDLFRLTFQEDKQAYHAEKIRNFGDNVWPVSLTQCNRAFDPTVLHGPVEKMTASSVTEEDLEALSVSTANRLFAGRTQAKQVKAENSQGENDLHSHTQVEEAENLVTLELTAKDAAGLEIASHDGQITVTYDEEALQLLSVAVFGDHSAKLVEENTIHLAYVSMDALAAGEPVARLTFKALDSEDTAVTVQQICVDGLAGVSETLPVEFTHEHTELRDAKEATCTEAGYSGDLYCVDCGKLLQKGTVLDPLGHDWTEWTVQTEASCGKTGEESRTCTRCGETETRTIPALEHQWSDWTVTLVPTCFAEGEEMRTCTLCGEIQRRALPTDSSRCPSREFDDLSEKEWYHEAIDFVLSEGIMEGMGHHSFAPQAAVTRGQMVTMLYRLSGAPEVSGTLPFEDVKADFWYTDAILWAYENGIAMGMSETRFAPQAELTREQMVSFLYRYAAFSGRDVSAEGDLEAFSDAEAVQDYARIPMAWAVEEQLIVGMDGKLVPQGTASRAQAAAVLFRYMH